MSKHYFFTAILSLALSGSLLSQEVIVNSGNEIAGAAEQTVRNEMRNDPNRGKEEEFAPQVNNENALGLGAPKDRSNSANNQGASSEDLTDAERVLKDEFVHSGLEQRKIQEECNASPEMRKACRGREVEGEFLGMKSGMVKAVAKAYSTVLGALSISGGSSGLKGKSSTSTDTTTKKKTTTKEDDTKDYCQYIPIATETIATFQQKTAQESIQGSPGNSETNQKSALHKAARSHGERAKTAKIQTTGWGSTTACYVYVMTKNKATLDFKSAGLWLKVGSAGLLTAFYASEVKNHENYRDKINDIANKLPGKGDCNPVDQRDCYCAQPETQYDPDFCLPNVLKNFKAKKDNFRTTCIDKNLNNDDQCSCVKSNSCFDREFETKISGFGGLNQGLSSPLLNNFASLTRGQLSGGAIQGSELTAARSAVNLIKRNIDKIPKSDVSLNKKQREDAKLIEEFGIPAVLAERLALEPFTKNAQANIAKFQGDINSKNLKALSKSKPRSSSKVVTFESGKGSTVRKKDKSKFDFFSRFNKKNKKKSRKGNNQEVINFAEKASQKAAITNDRSRQIFEIISRRYQSTGFKMLEGNN